MINELKECLWRQFAASIDMLKNAIELCPDEHWDRTPKLFYQAYHCLVFLDYYLTNPPDNFTSALPFSFADPDHLPPDVLDDLVPERTYSKQESLVYLQASREKCRSVISGLSVETINDRWIENPGNMNYALFEILLYNMRHVQHHAAQMNLLLRQTIHNAPGWVGRSSDSLSPTNKQINPLNNFL